MATIRGPWPCRRRGRSPFSSRGPLACGQTVQSGRCLHWPLPPAWERPVARRTCPIGAIRAASDANNLGPRCSTHTATPIWAPRWWVEGPANFNAPCRGRSKTRGSASTDQGRCLRAGRNRRIESSFQGASLVGCLLPLAHRRLVGEDIVILEVEGDLAACGFGAVGAVGQVHLPAAAEIAAHGTR